MKTDKYFWSYSRCTIDAFHHTDRTVNSWHVKIYSPYKQLIATNNFDSELTAILWCNRHIDSYFNALYAASKPNNS